MGNYTFDDLNSINLKYYSQTCSNEHLCNNPCWVGQSKFLFNCYYLTRPATTFFDSHMRKKLVLNNNYKSLSSKRMRKKQKEECIKNKHLSDYIYSITNS